MTRPRSLRTVGTAELERQQRIYEQAQTERQFMGQVVELAKLLGWMAYHTYDSRRSAEGFPDLVLVRPPRLIFAELKTDTGRLTPAQYDWLDQLGACQGPEAYTWRPRDLEAIATILQQGRQTQA